MARTLLEDVPASRLTSDTVRRMYELVDRAKTDASFQKLVYGVVNAAMPGQWKDYRRELTSFFNWAKRAVDYRRDPYGVELLQDVWATLDRRRGDCIPLDQKIVVKDKATNRYAVVEIGSLKKSFGNYEALSYNFEESRWEFKPITRWIDKGRKKVFSVRMANGTSFRCTADHKLFRYNQGRGYKIRNGLPCRAGTVPFDVKPLSEINKVSGVRPSLAMVRRIPSLDSSIDRSEDYLWCYGRYIADGWVGGRHSERIQIGGDGLKREALCERLDRLKAPYSKSKREVSSAVSLLKSGFRSEFSQDIRGKYAWGKDLPEDFLSLSANQIDAFIDGYGNYGDDFVPKHGVWKDRVERIHNTCSFELAKKLMFLHWLKGDVASLWTQEKHGGAGKHVIYRVLVWKRADRKQDRYKERMPGISNGAIKEVVELAEAEVCDITVEGTHNFVLENGVIAHNCDDFTILLSAAAEILGAPSRIVTVSTRADKEPNHVFPEAYVSGTWHTMDATVPGSTFGWRPSSVTDKKVWTRKELGLSGGDDTSGIEGFGMSDGNGYDVPGFRTGMRPVSRELAPGVPDDISETWADPSPGPSMLSRRRILQAPIANVADRTSDPRPGGGVYNPSLPIESIPTPAELFTLVQRKLVPKVLNPNRAWWGEIPTSREDFQSMYPGSEAAMANYLKDVDSIPAAAIAELTQDINQQVLMGEIGEDGLEGAIGEALEDFAMGRLPRMKRPPSDRKPRTKGIAKGISTLKERRYLVPGPRVNLVPVRGGMLNGMGSLGDIISDIAKSVSSLVVNGVVPGDTTAINQAIDQAIDQATKAPTPAAPAPAPAPTTSVATVAKTAIPMGMLLLLGGVAWVMSRQGGSRRYRSNPSRRRSRGRGRRSRRSSGIDPKMLMIAGAAGAAWYFLLRPGAALLPSAPKPAAVASAPASVAQPSQTNTLLTAAAKAAPSIIDSITKLFSSGGSSDMQKITTDYSTAGAQPVPGIVTMLPDYNPNAESQVPSSEFVTSLT